MRDCAIELGQSSLFSLPCLRDYSALRRSPRLLRCPARFLILALALLPPSVEVKAQSSPAPPIYLDPSQPIGRRVDDLMSRMTLKEKIGQLNLPCVYVDELGKDIPSKMQACRRFAAGTYTREIGPGCGFFTLADTILHEGTQQQVDYFNELQKIALTETRLKIPLLEDEEGTHGAMFPGATVFPEGLALGSTFDMPLVESIYAAAAAEARSVGIHILSTLVLELDRDPRMGRNEEAYTEDPYLDSRIASSIVRGAQGSNIDAPDKVIALMTDFPTQSEPTSGLERGSIELSDRSLRENTLPPWIAAFNAGALGVMAGYPEVEDVPAHASGKWLTRVLRQELGFRGIVVSEGGGFDSLIYEDIAPDQSEAGALALKAGVDVGITYEEGYMGPLVRNVEEGRVPVALVDRSVRRVLEQKFRLGLFEHPYADAARAERVMHSQEHQQLALRAAREGIVLLKNENDLLPLAKSAKAIAVIGPDADSAANLFGDYAPEVVPQRVETILDALKAKVPSGTRVVYAKGCAVNDGDKSGFPAAIEAAKHAGVAIMVLGEQARREGSEDRPPRPTDGEGYDVASLDLTGVQEDLLEAVAATGTPTVLVLVNGRPLSVRWAADHLPAIVEAWEPGEQGAEAVADVLFGNFNPTGRLAITIPRSVGQLPAYYDYKPSKAYWIGHGWSHDRGYVDMPGTPLYPFGYGLSYTQFQYTNLHIEPAQIYTGGNARVTVDVSNIGKRAGVDTVQLYFHERYAPVATAVKQLRGFERVALEPGERKTVTFTLGPDDLRLLDRDLRWRVVPGTFDVMIGKSSAEIPLEGTLRVMGSEESSGK
ncbi:MAG TPA: glycoside hydrolase family 3 C-terminal domain-containing protein [Terriglobia bacterium]|nr:glycoside hydrolase family 3 C-terminal domain-containing protein [Terriglobia bacterium]